MKITDLLKEMTMQAGSYKQLSKYINFFDKLNSTGTYIGDIEQYQVFKSIQDPVKYSVYLKDTLVAFFQVQPDGTVDAIYVVPAHRLNGLMSVILFFIKKNLGYRKINLGTHHSNSTIEAVKRIYKRFDAYWEKDGKRIPYSPDTVDQFYSVTGPTGWKLFLENTNNFTNETKFFNPMLLDSWYFNLIE